MKSFPLLSPLNAADRAKINTTRKATPRAIATCVFRRPKSGEWYLPKGSAGALRADKPVREACTIASLVPRKTRR